jgi:hypothetical protein
MLGIMVITALFPILVIGSFFNPVFGDHSYLGRPIEHSNTTIEEFLIEYMGYGAHIKKVQVDYSEKKLVFDVYITETPAFLEIDLPRDLLDSKDDDEDEDYKISYDGNRAGYDEVESSSSHRTLNISLRGVTTSEFLELEIFGSQIFDKHSQKKLNVSEEKKIEKIKVEEIEQEVEIEEVKLEQVEEIEIEQEVEEIELVVQEPEPKEKIMIKQNEKPEQKQGPKHIPQLHQMIETLMPKPKQVKEVIQEPIPELVIDIKQEPKIELSPIQESEPTNFPVATNTASQTISDTILAEVKPNLKIKSMVNLEQEDEIIEEDTCFICKNKKKSQSVNPQIQQLREQIENEKAEIEEPEEEGFLDRFFKLFQGIFS